MFTINKYYKIYFEIVEKNRDNLRSSNREKHHIIPTAIGGPNNKTNIVYLSPKEHFICHRLLPKMLIGVDKQKMCLAAWTMARTRKNLKITSKTYEVLKRESSVILSDLFKGKAKKPLTLEHKEKIRLASIKRYEDPQERLKTSVGSTGKSHTTESKMKMSLNRIGKTCPPSYGMRSKTHSEETKKKMKEAWVRRKQKVNSKSSLICENKVS